MPELPSLNAQMLARHLQMATPLTMPYVEQSAYLADALQQMREHGGDNIRTPFALGANLLAEALTQSTKSRADKKLAQEEQGALGSELNNAIALAGGASGQTQAAPLQPQSVSPSPGGDTPAPESFSLARPAPGLTAAQAAPGVDRSTPGAVMPPVAPGGTGGAPPAAARPPTPVPPHMAAVADALGPAPPPPAPNSPQGILGHALSPQDVQKVESNNNPNAVSPAGAQGLMQLMPGTSSDPGFGVQPAQNASPQENQRVGSDYLAAMTQKYGGNQVLAAIAYNWGPGHTDHWLAAGADPRHLPKETREYVASLALQGARPGQGQGGPAQPPAPQAIQASGGPGGGAAGPAPGQASAEPPPQGVPELTSAFPGVKASPQEIALLKQLYNNPRTIDQARAFAYQLEARAAQRPEFDAHFDPNTGQTIYYPKSPGAAPIQVAQSAQGWRAPPPANMQYDASGHLAPQYKVSPPSQLSPSAFGQTDPWGKVSVTDVPGAAGPAPPGTRFNPQSGRYEPIPGAGADAPYGPGNVITLRDQINGAKPITEARDALTNYSALTQLARQPGGIKAYGVRDALARMFSGGMARGQQVYMQMHAMGVPDSVVGYFQNLKGDGDMDPRIMQQSLDAAFAYTQSRLGAATQYNRANADFAQRRGIDPRDIQADLGPAPSFYSVPGQRSSYAPHAQESQADRVAATLAQARQAVTRGASRQAVAQRLQQMGINPAGL